MTPFRSIRTATARRATRHSRAYLHHLFKAEEMLGPMLLTWHNVSYYQIADARPACRHRRAPAGRARQRHPRRLDAGGADMTEENYTGLTQLGHHVEQPASPDAAKLERVPNPSRDKHYLVRFTCPEFTSLCPITGQPDFAHIVIDYIPRDWIVESKSLKLYLTAFRNHGAFHEACTMGDRRDADYVARSGVAAHRRLLVSARRHPDRCVLADRHATGRRLDPATGRGAVPWPRITHMPDGIVADRIAAAFGPICRIGRAPVRCVGSG